MDISTVLRQAILFAHVVTFAMALSTVLRADIGLMNAQRLDSKRLANTARIVTHALIGLWATGLTLVVWDVGLDVTAFSPKLAAKLLVVSALTANGLALHTLAFPLLTRAQSRGGVLVPVVLGAISTASWLYATFLGVARLIAPSMSFTGFIALYCAVLTASIAVALVFVRPRVERLLCS
jgi:sulfite exporter TauE/SafE